jgi:hypothetical protein
MLSNVFTAALGPSGGPEVKLFSRFQKQWSSMNSESYTPGNDALFVSDDIIQLRLEMSIYYSQAMKAQQPREDYRELLSLCQIFLGRKSVADVKFRAPGAIHQARWMAKAIYCLKLYMFQDQFVLTAAEKKGVTEVSLFVSLIYAKYWNEAPLADRAPQNDINLLCQLRIYPTRVIAEAAEKAFRRHLWYISEHLIGLALFDSRVSADVKSEMVKNLRRPAMEKNLRRLDSVAFEYEHSLDTYVTERTAELFDVVVKNGRERAAAFLEKDPADWSTDETFCEMQQKVRQLKVVNDSADRGIALISAFNSTITKDERQKQYLLRLVDEHRKQYPVASKSAVMQMAVHD